MPRIAVFQHVAYEPLGTLHAVLKDQGLRLRYFNFGREHHAVPDLKRYDGLVVLGGPMGVYEADRYPHLLDEITCIKNALAMDKPVLGICLGSQLLAAALGAKVYRGEGKEIGWYEVDFNPACRTDRIFAPLGERETIFQWHGDTFDLPLGTTLLASSRRYPHQAYRYGNKTYGLQFHLEVDRAMIERWLTVPVNAAELEPLGGAALAARIRSDNLRHLARMQRLARGVFQRLIAHWLDIL